MTQLLSSVPIPCRVWLACGVAVAGLRSGDLGVASFGLFGAWEGCWRCAVRSTSRLGYLEWLRWELEKVGKGKQLHVRSWDGTRGNQWDVMHVLRTRKNGFRSLILEEIPSDLWPS